MSRFGVVFFDVDSTLVSIEGIDVLAGGNEEVARLTAAAMNGDIPIDDVYRRRLEILRPSRDQIRDLSTRYVAALLPDAKEVFETLRQRGIDVHLVTAGIEQAVEPLAKDLGIEPRALHAVRLTFEDDGSYSGFDERSPLTRSGGKEMVVLDVRARTARKSSIDRRRSDGSGSTRRG